MPAKIYEKALEFQKQLGALEDAAASRMAARYKAVTARIDVEVAALTKAIEAAIDAGEEYSPSWLFRKGRLESLKAQIEAEMLRFGKLAAQDAKAAQSSSYSLGAQAAKGIVLSAATDATWSTLPARQAEKIVGFMGDGSPLEYKFAGMATELRDAIEPAFTTGVALGWGPERILGKISQIKGQTLTNAATVVRTEVLRAYRAANMDSYRANAHIVRGWRWACSHSARTCASCWAVDGTFHTLEEDFTDHPRGRCVAIPVVFLNGKPIPEAWNTEEQFAAMPERIQRAALGKTRFELLQKGEISLRDLATRYESETFGNGYRLRNLEELAAAKGTPSYFALGEASFAKLSK